MKFLIAILVALLCSPAMVTARGGGHDKVTSYDYHDYLDEAIQSKTFIRYRDGIEYDLVWSFDRSVPGEVLRTAIATDANGDIVVYQTARFETTSESFNLVESQRFDPSATFTAIFDPPVVKLTDSMVPGIAWASAGEHNSTSGGERYFTDSSEVVAIENVSVPAGSFSNCLKIYSQHQYGAVGVHSQMDWICPDVGLVKRIHNYVQIELTSVSY